ncbi:hypothetical protein LTR17_005432 [Elasticomyces elasticus]|nr:hypothetical protein LTR17_005432 [Elasticomyces elasticus]
MSPNAYRNNIIPLENRLGFNFSRGLSRTKGRLNIPVIAELEKAYDDIIATHCKYSRLDVLPYAELEASADRTFELLGPRLWPEPEDDKAGYRFQWLADASENNLTGRYPQDLYFAREHDRQQLRQTFSEWVKAKCFCFERNHPEWTPRQVKTLGHEATAATAMPPSVLPDNQLDESVDPDYKPDYDPGDDDGNSRAPPAARSSTTSQTPSHKRKSSVVDLCGSTDDDDDTTDFLVEAGLAERQQAHNTSVPRSSGWTPITAMQPVGNATGQSSSNAMLMVDQSQERAQARRHSSMPQSVAADEPLDSSRPVRAAALKKRPTYTDFESDEDLYDGDYVALHPDEAFCHIGNGWYRRGEQSSAQGKAAAKEPTPKRRRARKSAPPTAHSTADATTASQRTESRPAELTLLSESQLPADVSNNHSQPAPEPAAAPKGIEAEIDWANPEEFPSFIPLASCHSVEDLFTLIDQQRSPAVQQLPFAAVKVKHVNFETGKGKNASCRITRTGAAGSETFRIMLDRLKQYDGDSELRVTVEWT